MTRRLAAVLVLVVSWLALPFVPAGAATQTVTIGGVRGCGGLAAGVTARRTTRRGEDDVGQPDSWRGRCSGGVALVAFLSVAWWRGREVEPR